MQSSPSSYSIWVRKFLGVRNRVFASLSHDVLPVMATISVFLAFPAYSYDQKPWEKDCLDLQKNNSVSCGGLGADFSHIQNLHTQMLSSPSGQSYIEREFLWNFLNDQSKQTKCDQDTLAPFDLAPSDGTVCSDVNGNVDVKTSFEIGLCKANPDSPMCRTSAVKVRPVSEQALARQQKIVSEVWAVHTALLRESDACDNWSKKKFWSDAKESAEMAISTASGLNLLSSTVVQTSVQADREENFHCSLKGALLQKIWRGQTPEMQTFLNSWLDKFRQNPALSESDFRATAVPVGADHKIKEAPDALTLEGAIWKMSCNAKRRQDALKDAMELKEGQLVPKANANDPTTELGKKTFNALMGDGGQAMNAFLQRSVYAGVAGPMACHLLKQYQSEWDHTKTYKVAKIAVEGGGAVAVMFIPGVNAAAAGFIFGVGVTAFEGYQSCKSVMKPGSLQVSNVCDLIKGHEKNYNYVASKVEAGDSCAASVTTGAAMTLAGSLGGNEAKAALEIKALTADSAQIGERALASEGTGASNLARDANATTFSRPANSSVSGVSRVTAASARQNPAQLAGFGLSDAERVTEAEQGLKNSGFLGSDLTDAQKSVLQNHFYPEGTSETASFGEHSSDALRLKMKTATDAGFTQQQADYLIRNGFAGTTKESLSQSLANSPQVVITSNAGKNVSVKAWKMSNGELTLSESQIHVPDGATFSGSDVSVSQSASGELTASARGKSFVVQGGKETSQVFAVSKDSTQIHFSNADALSYDARQQLVAQLRQIPPGNSVTMRSETAIASRAREIAQPEIQALKDQISAMPGRRSISEEARMVEEQSKPILDRARAQALRAAPAKYSIVGVSNDGMVLVQVPVTNAPGEFRTYAYDINAIQDFSYQGKYLKAITR